MQGLRLYKKEKLCSLTAIEILFGGSRRMEASGVKSALAYPWRVVWRFDSRRSVTCPRFLVSVPKKRLRHAVDRVKMRRRCREAYRLSRHIIGENLPVDIAFVYVANSLTPYSSSLGSVRKLLARIAASAPAPSDEKRD